MKTVYVALSLTHVKSEEERSVIRAFLEWLKTFDIELLMWAFDLDTWQPKKVDNVYEVDSAFVDRADLVIFLYLSSEGSDGRGGELVQRATLGKPMIALAREDVKISRYVVDCFKSRGVEITRFQGLVETEQAIRSALEALETWPIQY